MLREDYNFLVKLEELKHKRKNFHDKNFEPDLKNKFPIEKSTSTFLNNCPDYENKYRMDLARSYIFRKKIKKENLASFLVLDIFDNKEEINVIDFNEYFRVILVGY